MEEKLKFLKLTMDREVDHEAVVHVGLDHDLVVGAVEETDLQVDLDPDHVVVQDQNHDPDQRDDLEPDHDLDPTNEKLRLHQNDPDHDHDPANDDPDPDHRKKKKKKKSSVPPFLLLFRQI